MKLQHMAAGALVLASAGFVLGCGGSSASKDADTPTTEIAGDETSVEESPGGEARVAMRASSGEVLPYLPANCPAGRIYVDVSTLLASSSAQSVLRKMTAAVLDRESDDKDVQAAVGVLRKSGFDLATGIREAAMCMGKGDDHVMAAKFTIDDPMALLNDIAAAVGEERLPVTERGGAQVFAHDDFAFVQPAPGVLVIGAKPRAMQAIDREGAGGFKDAGQHVAFLDMDVDDAHMELKLSQAGSKFELWGAMHMRGETADIIATHPEEFKVEMRKKLLEEARELKGTPFGIVYERAREVDVDAGGDTVTAAVSFPVEDVTTLLRAAAPMLGVQLEGQGPSPQQGPGTIDTMEEFLDIIRKTK